MLHPAKRPLTDDAADDTPDAQRARLERHAGDEQRPAISVPHFAGSGSSHAHESLPFFPTAQYRDGSALSQRSDGGMALAAPAVPGTLLSFATSSHGRSFAPGGASGADAPPLPLPASVAAPRAPAASSPSSSSRAAAAAAPTASGFASDGRPSWCSPAGWERVKWIHEQHPSLLPTPKEYAPTVSERLEQVLAGEEAVIVYRSGAIELTRLWDKRKTGERVGCVRLILPLAHVCKEQGWPLVLVKAPEKRSKFFIRFALDSAAGTANATRPLYFDPTLAAVFPTHQIWLRRAVASAEQDAEPWILYRQNPEQAQDPRVLSMERNLAIFMCLRLGS